MAATTVFVDDAVLGNLPPVCAKTGDTTEDHLVLTVPTRNNGLGVAWLLLLLGPVGWLVLFVYAVARRDETLTVRVPFSDRSYGELSHARRRQRALGWSTVATFLCALFVTILHTFTARATAAALATIGLALLVSWIAESLRVRRVGVGVELDGSRRWVTLSRVHGDFVRAVDAARGQDSEHRRSPLRQPS
jgi:hypothetical protein